LLKRPNLKLCSGVKCLENKVESHEILISKSRTQIDHVPYNAKITAIDNTSLSMHKIPRQEWFASIP
jgi:hypothetical protein